MLTARIVEDIPTIKGRLVSDATIKGKLAGENTIKGTLSGDAVIKGSIARLKDSYTEVSNESGTTIIIGG